MTYFTYFRSIRIAADRQAANGEFQAKIEYLICRASVTRTFVDQSQVKDSECFRINYLRKDMLEIGRFNLSLAKCSKIAVHTLPRSSRHLVRQLASQIADINCS